MNRDKLRNIKLIRECVLRWRRWRSSGSWRHGHRNRVVCNGIRIGTRIQIDGSGNEVHIEADAVVRDCLIKIIGNGNRIHIGRNCFLAGAELWMEDDNGEINIGEDTFIGHHSHLACTEDGHKITIGSDSLVSSYVQVRTGDSHSIMTMGGERINKAADVCLGKHCWLGQGCKILKGSILAGDNVVGTGSVVSGSFESNCLIAGVPAKILKNDITWRKERV